jgi:hypothetical protein
MEFPQYRKLPNDKVFYRIESQTVFTELQLVGSRILVHRVEAKQYPEKLRIMDMLGCAEPFVIAIENEFEERLV